MMSIKIDKEDKYWTVTLTVDNSTTLPKRCDTWKEVKQIVDTAIAANDPDQKKIEDYTGENYD